MALERCVSTSPDDFRDRIFGRRHLHSTAAELPGGFADLFSPEALDDVLATGLRTSSIRLLRDNVEAPVTKGTVTEEGDSPGSAPFVSTDTVRAALASGHTLIIRSLQRIHPRCAAWRTSCRPNSATPYGSTPSSPRRTRRASTSTTTSRTSWSCR